VVYAAGRIRTSACPFKVMSLILEFWDEHQAHDSLFDLVLSGGKSKRKTRKNKRKVSAHLVYAIGRSQTSVSPHYFFLIIIFGGGLPKATTAHLSQYWAG
jgi:hypothetical protein